MIRIMWNNHSLFAQRRTQDFEAGESLFHASATVQRVFLVQRGVTALVRPLPSGEEAVLQRARPGQIVAEASVYAQRYHCDCRAIEATAVASVPRQMFLDALRADPELSANWAAHLARGVQQARMLAEIRSLKTVAARLDAWIAEYGAIPEKGQWQTLASELSIRREALYRELARRRKV